MLCLTGYAVRACLMDTYGGYAWASTPMPVRIVGLAHTLRCGVGNQFYDQEKTFN